MIIDFTIKNFRSIRDEKVFSMHVENPKGHLTENIAYPGNGKIGVLKTAGLYGANASGKSNVLLAFRALQWIADESGDLKEDSKIPCYEPYLLSDTTSDQPVVFELEFFNSDSIRYVYSVSFISTEIISESLDFYPSRQKANLFKREEGDTWETISFGGLYKGGTKRIPFFKNNSYLAKAGNNAGASEIIRSVYNYFRKVSHVGTNPDYFFSQIYQDELLLTKISSFLCNVDTGIKSVQKRENKNPTIANHLPDDFPEHLKEELVARDKFKFFFSHSKDDGGVVAFREAIESDGTRKLFHMLPMLLDAFSDGAVLIMDELDNSLHPHIAELLIKLFNDPVANSRNAQLVFSTHNINLMSPSLLRRDQIWFVEKEDGASSLYSLDEFDKSSVKSNSPFGHWYDEGRFGALPHINYAAIREVLRQGSNLAAECDADDEELAGGENA